MHPDVQQFVALWQAKSAAKQEALAAVGAAKFADYDGRPDDAARYWRIVEEKGIGGEEGRLYAEAFALAEKYVSEHPVEFASFEHFVNPDDHEVLVRLIGLMGKSGRDEEAAKLTMFELVKFERQHIGGTTQAVVRR